jgi:hypothetical protein
VLKKAQMPVSSTSSPYSAGSPKVFSESSQSPPSSNPSDESPPVHNSDKPVDVQPVEPFTAGSGASTFPSVPVNWENFDYSSFLPPDSNALPADFDGMFDGFGNTASHDPLTGPSILEELGLGGEWQPVMDHLGLS